MAKSLCIIHANCQGDSLRQLLLSSPSFAQLFRVEKYTNYLEHDIPAISMDQCALFLYQHIGDHWGENASRVLLQRVSQHAQTIAIPNMFFNGYWPLYTRNTFMAFGDMFLEDLAKKNLKPAEIKHLYLKGNMISLYDFDALYKSCRDREVEKEKFQDIKCLHTIDEFWKKEQLFYTLNHPMPRLSLYVADSVLQILGLAPLSAQVRTAFAAQCEEFEQPIHPRVGEYFHLPFATPQRLYEVFGQKMTFEQYVTAYISCRLQEGEHRVNDFVVYLHLLKQKLQKNET